MENTDIIFGASCKTVSANVGSLILITVGILFLGACKPDSKNSEDSTEPIESKKIEAMTTIENSDTTAPITYSEKIKDIPNATANGASGGNANFNYQTTEGSSGDAPDLNQLYSVLEMTLQQIDEFQNAMRSYQKNLGGSNGNKSAGSLDEERAKHLKIILSDEQFKKYESLK